MSRLTKLLALIVLLALIGGGLFLMTWDIPPPTATVERPLPDERFPK